MHSHTGGPSVATLLDTSALTVFIRRSAPAETERVRQACRSEVESGRALVSAVTATELLVGVDPERAAADVERLIESMPVVAVDREIAAMAGTLGACTRSRGATVPLADLMIAATAIWLDVPLLTCDPDFSRGAALGAEGPSRSAGHRAITDRGAGLWRRLALHPASVPAG